MSPPTRSLRVFAVYLWLLALALLVAPGCKLPLKVLGVNLDVCFLNFGENCYCCC